MDYCVSPPVVKSLPVKNQKARFPVNRIFCVGRNYAAHAIEMGKDPSREAPFFFMKPTQAVIDASTPQSMDYPPMTNNLHHEIELVVAIGKGGQAISVADALSHVFGYAVGLDMTRRDLQGEAKDKGRPWEFGKAFAQSAPIGPISAVKSSSNLKCLPRIFFCAFAAKYIKYCRNSSCSFVTSRPDIEDSITSMNSA